MGMLIARCSAWTLAAIASGVTTTMVTRAADVALKEGRRPVLMAREAPRDAISIAGAMGRLLTSGRIFRSASSSF
jgi:3-polyprenyl-4-hydroxybenzoate decarboxylase